MSESITVQRAVFSSNNNNISQSVVPSVTPTTTTPILPHSPTSSEVPAHRSAKDETAMLYLMGVTALIMVLFVCLGLVLSAISRYNENRTRHERRRRGNRYDSPPSYTQVAGLNDLLPSYSQACFHKTAGAAAASADPQNDTSSENSFHSALDQHVLAPLPHSPSSTSSHYGSSSSGGGGGGHMFFTACTALSSTSKTRQDGRTHLATPSLPPSTPLPAAPPSSTTTTTVAATVVTYESVTAPVWLHRSALTVTAGQSEERPLAKIHQPAKPSSAGSRPGPMTGARDSTCPHADLIHTLLI